MAKVVIIESEAGWGSKVDEILEFPTREEAKEFVESYNRKHNPGMYERPVKVPDWYMMAQLETEY